ncbi:MAG: MFS transporter [Clostridia bacterium]|nr:MFS transporter [Clostridia bacterium]
MRLIVGIATFFDAFDAVSIAYVLPVIIPLWKIAPTHVGLLISVGYVGQILGAFFFGWFAERSGRLKSLTLSVAILGIMSFLCAVSWNYVSLLVFRFIQGFGLGGEVPVAAAYINELSKAKGRGKFVLLYELIFVVGLVMAALLGYWVVPHLGWHYMFLIGGAPALVIPLFLRFLPESPRWLANHGRIDEAEKLVTDLERIMSRNGQVELPPVQEATVTLAEKPTSWRELFQGIYLRRTLTVWVIWFGAYFVTYGLTTWLPALYSSVFKLPLQQSLLYSLITSVAGFIGAFICALLIDTVGRKAWFTMAFLGGALFMFALWQTGARTPQIVVTYASLSYLFISSISLALYLYSPEIYPTRMRALGSSIGSAWLRVASAIGPYVVGVVVSSYSLSLAFAIFGLVALIAAVITGMFAVETKGKVLEEISP